VPTRRRRPVSQASFSAWPAPETALPTSTTARQAYDLLSGNFGPGVNGPLLIAVKLGSPAQPSGTQPAPSGTDPRATDPRLQTLEQDVSKTKGVAAVATVQTDKSGTSAYFNAIATTGPAEQATTDLVSTLRSTVIPAAQLGTDLKAYVGGTTRPIGTCPAGLTACCPGSASKARSTSRPRRRRAAPCGTSGAVRRARDKSAPVSGASG
jgi:hypothetical protein